MFPLTKITNKHLLPVYDKPVIFYPIETLVGAGIEVILVFNGGRNAGDFLRLLANGKLFGLKHLNYAYQVFDKVKSLIPFARKELEITGVNNAYILEDAMAFSYLVGWWTDVGTFESLLRAGNLVAQSRHSQGAREAETPVTVA